jgi:hypothetical protein
MDARRHSPVLFLFLALTAGLSLGAVMSLAAAGLIVH